jgi:tRNA(Ile)-lysidine synthase
MCLAKLLLDLQPKWQWHLAIAHCDHRWRSDSAANAAFVQQQAHGWNLPYAQVTAEIAPTTEAAAREWRYRSLATLARQQTCSIVVTGHTASDRAETLLYNLIRGSGLDGLQALSRQRSLTPTVQLVRPLLDITRPQTAAFCKQHHLTIWEDSTNQDLTYARNRLRLEVLPYLRTHFNPQLDRTLAHTAEVIQAEVEFLNQAAAHLYQHVIAPDSHHLNRCILHAAPLALQRRVARQVLQTRLPITPEFVHVEKLVNLIPAPNRTQTDPFPGGAIAYVDGDWIRWKSDGRSQESRHR